MEGMLAGPPQRSSGANPVFVANPCKRRSWQKEWILPEADPLQHSDHRHLAITKHVQEVVCIESSQAGLIGLECSNLI